MAALSGTCQMVMKLGKSYHYHEWGQFVEYHKFMIPMTSQPSPCFTISKAFLDFRFEILLSFSHYFQKIYAYQTHAKMEQLVYPEDQLIHVNVLLDGWAKIVTKNQVGPNFDVVLRCLLTHMILFLASGSASILLASA